MHFEGDFLRILVDFRGHLGTQDGAKIEEKRHQKQERFYDEVVWSYECERRGDLDWPSPLGAPHMRARSFLKTKNQSIKGRRDQRMRGWMDEGMNGWMDEVIKGWRDEGMNGWMDEGMNGWRDEGWMNGWMDEGMKGWLARSDTPWAKGPANFILSYLT